MWQVFSVLESKDESQRPMKKINFVLLVIFCLSACSNLLVQVQPLPVATSTALPESSPTLLPSPTATAWIIPTEEILISTPLDARDANFNNVVLKSPQPVIVDFWATWCMDCKPLAENLTQIAKEYAGKVIVVKVNVEESEERTHWYGVNALPAVFFFVKGKVTHRVIGSMTEAMLRTAISEYFGVP
jgi:thioredoxin